MKNLIRETILYGTASALALVADFGLLWLLVSRAGLHYLIAAAIAFLAGTAIVYALSVSLIFRHRNISDRRREFGVFTAIGVIGLLVNLAVLHGAVAGLGAHYLAGKLAAVVCTFSLNFWLRRTLLFAAGRPATAPILTTGTTG